LRTRGAWAMPMGEQSQRTRGAWTLPVGWALPSAHVALGLCLRFGHFPPHTWHLSSAYELDTPQRTRGAWATLGWEQVVLGSWLSTQRK